MVLAVSAGVVIYAYTMGYLGGFGGTEQLGAMSVDEYSANTTNTGYISVFVRNIGKTTIDLNGDQGASIYVDGVVVDGWGENRTAADGTSHAKSVSVIPEGEVQRVVIDPSQTLTAGTTYEVKVIAADNTQTSFSVKAK